MTPLSFDVGAAEAGMRLDRFLSLHHPDLSRARWQQLIADRLVSLNGAPTKPGAPLKPGDVIAARVPPPVEATPRPEAVDLDILYEDDDYVIVNKPAGMVVHHGAGHDSGTLVNALLHHCGNLSNVGGVMRPGIVHRLDKDTSGVMAATKNDLAHRFLAEQFAAHTIERAYEAIVWGVFSFSTGTVEGLIGRDPRNRLRMTGRTTSGRRAVTHYKVTAATRHFSRVECRLETGRTHQIRVHMAESHHPVVGDPLYGKGRSIPASLLPELREALAAFNRQALHARVLGFTTRAGKTIRVEAEPPVDMQRLWQLIAEQDR